MFQPARHFFAETDRWFLWLPVGLGIGVGLYFSGQVEPPQWLGICLLVVLVAIGYVGRRTTHIYLISVGLGVTALGFTAAQFRTAEVSHIVLAKKIGPTTLEGRVKLIETFTDGARLTLDNTRIHRLGGDLTPSVVRIRVKTKLPNLRPGDWITARASLRPPPPPAMPGSFDFQRQLYFKAIGATGFTYGGVKIVSRQNDAKVVSIWWQGIRHDLSTHIRESIGGSAGAIAAALITGDRGSIPKNILTAFRESGLAHLLAISGLHIGLVAGILLVGIRTILALIPILALRYPIKKWAAFLAIIGAFAYAILAGATVPTQRAFVMVSLVLLAVILDRQGISMRLVAIAAGIILLFRPESLLGASFQLSFAAVIALIAGYEYLSERRIGTAREIRNRRGILQPLTYFFGIATTTVIATLATSPFAIYHFNQVAVFGLIANIIAVPLVALWIMPFAVVSLALLPFGLDLFPFAAMGGGIDLVIWVATTISAWDGAVYTVPALPTFAIVLISMGGLWLCLWRRPWRLFGAPIVIIGLAALLVQRPPDILIDDRGKLFAVKSADGSFLLSSRRVSKFVGQTWLRRVGHNSAAKSNFPKTGYGKDGRLACDQLGCILKLKGQTIGLIMQNQALPEDCRLADVIISAVPVFWACPSAKLIIDRFDLYRNGSHAVWIDDAGVTVKSVNQERGYRPWVLRPKRRGAK